MNKDKDPSNLPESFGNKIPKKVENSTNLSNLTNLTLLNTFPLSSLFGSSPINFVENLIGDSKKKQDPNPKKKTVNSTTKGDVVSVTYEEIGLWPRSFSRVLDRFLKQVFSDVENLVIQEYRFYRYLFLTTVRCLCILFFVPFLVNFFAKNYLIHPLTEYFWNTQQNEIFLNLYQQKHAFAELKEFEEKLYFESFIPSNSTFGFAKNIKTSTVLSPDKTGELTQINSIQNKNLDTNVTDSLVNSVKDNQINNSSVKTTPLNLDNSILPGTSSMLAYLSTEGVDNIVGVDKIENATDPKGSGQNNTQITGISTNINPEDLYKQKLQEKTVEIATHYNEESIEAITNFFADLLSFLTLIYLLFSRQTEINITKSFLLEVFFGLDDSKKSLLILLVTDLLVGYHSSNLWELFFEFIFHHYGLPESQTGIFLLVATLPVLLDVLFKYLIFRHLNRSSPATVATYHAMIE